MNLLEVSETEAASLKEQATLAATDGLARILEVMADAEIRLRDAASKKILLEVTLLRAIEARNAVNLDAVLRQLNALHGNHGNPDAKPQATPPPALANGRRLTPTPAPAAPVTVSSAAAEKPTTPAATAATSSVTDAGELETLWTRLVEAAGRASPFVKTYLLEAHPVSFARGLFTIGFDPEFDDHRGLVDNARNHALLQTKLAELGHANCQFKCIKAEAPADRRPSTPATALPAPSKSVAAAPSGAPQEIAAPVAGSQDDFKNDPLIQKALEVFKGQIVNIRA
jgi:DNA polymerase-3 subunit gamma/tau